MSQLISYNIGPRYNGTSLYYALYDLIPCLFLDYYCNDQYRMLDNNECIKYRPKSTPTLSILLPLNSQARLLHVASSLSLCMIWPYCLPMFITVTIHYNGVIMSTTASQIISLTIVYSTFVQAQIKEDIKAPRHWPLCGVSPVTGEFPAQKASNAENVSIWWRHHEIPIVGHGLQRLPYVADMQVCIDGLLQFF